MILEVVRSEVRVVSSPSYIPFSRFPPAVICTLLGSFFPGAVVNYYSGVCYDSVAGDVLDSFEVKESHCVCTLGVICLTNLSISLGARL